MLRAARGPVILGTLIATALGAHAGRGLEFDNSLELWFLDDDPALVAYQRFIERFEADDIGVVALFGDVFSAEGLATVERLGRELAALDDVVKVRSLATARVARDVDGDVRIEPLVGGEHGEVVKARALANEATRSLIAADGRATALVVVVHPDNARSAAARDGLGRALREVAERVGRPHFEVAVTGGPPMDEAFNRYTERDFSLFGGFILGFVLAVIFAVFRRLTWTVVVISLVVIANVWTFGVMGAIGYELNIISSALFALILAVGVADSIHILAEYEDHLREGLPKLEAMQVSLRSLLVPCAFTSLTTAAGMLSLLTSQLRPVREFGLMAATAVGFAFLLSITWVPVCLILLPAGKPRPPPRSARVLAWLGRPSRRSSWAVVAVFVGLVALSAHGMRSLRVASSNPLAYFVEDDPVRLEAERVESALGGTASVEFVIEAEAGGLLEPELLSRLDALQRMLEQVPGVSSTLSIVDVLVDLGRVVRGDGQRLLPRTREEAAQLALLLEGEEDLEELVQEDYSVARVSGAVIVGRASELVARLPAIEAELAGRFEGTGARAHITGIALLMGRVEHYIVSSQIKSFGIALLVITAMMILLLRSPRLGLIGMLPNVGTIALGLGFMALVDIAVDPVTSMIASIMLGLIVDDTVHFMARFKRLRDRGASAPEAIARTMREAGRPIVATSMALAAGFGVMLLASFTPNIHFGVVSVTLIVLALLVDLIVVPACLLLTARADSAGIR